MNEEKYYELKQQIEKYRNLFFEAQTVEDKEKYISKLEKVKQLLNKYIQEFGEPDINKTIIVDGDCKINRNNPTPIKKQDIAINIEALNSKTGFKNFVLGIDNDEDGVTWFGTLSSDIPEKIYVKTIKKTKLDDRQLKELKVTSEDLKFSNYLEIRDHSEMEEDAGGTIIFEIKDRDNNKYYAGVFNCHNGYYSHAIYENGCKIAYL